MCVGTKAKAGPQAAARLTAVMLLPPDSQPGCIIIPAVVVVVVIVLLHPLNIIIIFCLIFSGKTKHKTKRKKYLCAIYNT